MDNLLSVVILSYKNGEMLYETLDSILEQTYPNIEIVVCDDASPVFEKDGVEKYIADHNRGNISNAVVVVNPANLGTVKNLNVGIAHAKGNFLKFIAGDDLFASPDVCAIQMKYLEEHPDACLVVGNILECDDRMNPLSMSGFLLENDRAPLLRDRKALLKYLARKGQKSLATQAICFRKSFFEKYGLYDEEFKLIEDLPMAIRIAESGEMIGYVNLPCVKHRGSGVGVSTSNEAFDARRIRYYEDLEKFYAKSLMPLEHIVGRTFVRMRHGVCKFRIEYCKLDPPTAANKMKTVIRHLPHLLYYALTKTNRVLFYLRG
jgi:glycosyltransferase involved in cell wall biosynthesis